MVAGFGKVVCTKKHFRGSRCGLECNNNLVRSGPRQLECKSTRKWTHGKFACKPAPRRAIQYSGVGDQAPVFTFFSVAGNLGLRLESLGTGARQVYVELQNGKKGFKKSWMMGMLDLDFGLSFCYGTPSSKKCGLKIDATGTVHFLGSTFFHGGVKYTKAKPKKSPAPTLGEARHVGHMLGQGTKVKLDARLDARALSQGEVAKNPKNRVWWNGARLDEVGLLQTAETGGRRPSYHTKIGGAGAQTPAAKWKTKNGKIGLRLESMNAVSAKNVYLEMRNKARRDAWGVGIKKDAAFHMGYGILGSFKKKDFFKVSPNKEVSISSEAVFHKRPSYFKPGGRLKLMTYPSGARSTKPKYGNKFKARTKSAKGVPDTPQRAQSKLGSNSGAEPLVAYHSKDNVSIRLTAETTGARKEAFVEFRSQKKAAWRVAVHSDNSLYITYHIAGGTGIKAMKITTKGDVHMYGDVSFSGRTLKKF